MLSQAVVCEWGSEKKNSRNLTTMTNWWNAQFLFVFLFDFTKWTKWWSPSPSCKWKSSRLTACDYKQKSRNRSRGQSDLRPLKKIPCRPSSPQMVKMIGRLSDWQTLLWQRHSTDDDWTAVSELDQQIGTLHQSSMDNLAPISGSISSTISAHTCHYQPSGNYLDARPS